MNLYKIIDQLYYDMALNELRLMNDNMIYPNITYNSFLYINIISSYKDGCTVSFLAKLLCISKAAVTIKINDLLKQGFVEKRQSSEDRRVYYITVKPKILEEYKLFDKMTFNAVSKLEKEYSLDDINKFSEMMASLSSYYREATKNE